MTLWIFFATARLVGSDIDPHNGWSQVCITSFLLFCCCAFMSLGPLYECAIAGPLRPMLCTVFQRTGIWFHILELDIMCGGHLDIEPIQW